MDINLNTLAARARAAGLRVVILNGAQGNDRPGSFDPVGVLNHHTGASAKGWSLGKEEAYARWMAFEGRSDLPAPLVQSSLGRSCTVYLCASGRSNHAGTARASGSVSGGDGNSLYYGIEWMLSGTEAIPADMMQAGITWNAVLLEFVTETSEQTVSCHYNTSVTGKWDIGDPNGVRFGDKMVLDIAWFRREVAEERARLFDNTPSTPAKPRKTDYHWHQEGGLGDSVSGALTGIRKDFAEVLTKTSAVGSEATREGWDTPSGNGHGIDRRTIVRTLLKSNLGMLIAVIVGHAPPERAKNARARFMKVFVSMKAAIKAGDLNLSRRLVARLMPNRTLRGEGVIWLSLDKAKFKVIKFRTVNVGGDHKALYATLRHRSSGQVFTVLVINCMSYSAPKARSIRVFNNGLDLSPHMVLGVECTDFRAFAVDARRNSKEKAA